MLKRIVTSYWRVRFFHVSVALAILLCGLWQSAFAGTIGLPQASTVAARVDSLHDFLWWISVFSLGGTTVALILFVVKYHQTKTGRETAYILGSHSLEITWTVIPLILMLGVFAWGYRDYLFMRAEQKDALEINVVGRQWLWNFEYANGRKTMNELYLPNNTPIKLIMTSEDVLHSFFMPNMRMKNDVVPGMYTYISFTPTLVGEHPIYCAEYCGTGHSDMLGKIWVLEPADFKRWLETGKAPAIVKASATSAPTEGAPAPAAMSLADKGKELASSKGCIACHTADGTKKIGPTWKGIWGTQEELESGQKVTVDENYVRESIESPTARIVKGYPPSMPPFKGLLNDNEINALIAYIKSLK